MEMYERCMCHGGDIIDTTPQAQRFEGDEYFNIFSAAMLVSEGDSALYSNNEIFWSGREWLFSSSIMPGQVENTE